MDRFRLEINRRAFVVASGATVVLAGCADPPLKRSAGSLPADFKLEPLLVQTSFVPTSVKVEVRGSLRIEPRQKSEAQQLVAQAAQRVRDDFDARFVSDARAAGLPLRNSAQPGMTLTIRATSGEAGFTLPGAPGYRNDPGGDPFVTVTFVTTLADASGKELWWFKHWHHTTPELEALSPEMLLKNGYQYFMSQMLQAMRRDGILVEQRTPQK